MSSRVTNSPNDSGFVPPAGCLPGWQRQELPEPLPFTFRNVLRTIGPGAILLAGSIGGGEWIVGPLTTVRYGTGILWVATLGIFLQMIFNLEAIRYTLYTGEPILTGIMRLRPGCHVKWPPQPTPRTQPHDPRQNRFTRVQRVTNRLQIEN
ncbi:MAG: hypothetical protein ACKPJJ_07820, partial [Planctomycetaceae bacterium]